MQQAMDSIQSPMVVRGLAKFVSFAFHRFAERAIWAFAELDLATLMAEHQKPITATELSQLNGNQWNAKLLYRLLRAVADADIVKEIRDINGSESRFQLTESGFFLTKDHPAGARDFIRLELGALTHEPSTYLTDLIKDGYRNGNGFQRAFGATLFGYLQKEENKDALIVFDHTMTTYSEHFTPSIQSIVDFSRFKTLVDVGASAGTLLSMILKDSPTLHGIAFDLAPVVEHVRMTNPNEFQKRGIESERYKYVAGDMFDPATIPPADAYILKHIIHDWDDDDAIRIFKSIHSANTRGSQKTGITVFLVEMVILPGEISNWEARMLDMEMLTLLSAKERTLPEYQQLLRRSGFEVKQFYRTKGVHSIIEAVSTDEEPSVASHNQA